VAICGDGDFLMNGQEIATAFAHGATPLIIVIDNGVYATIVSHQENHYPGRPSGTRMVNPDFATWMRAFDGGAGAASAGVGMSGHGERVETTRTSHPHSIGPWPRTGRRSSTYSSILRPCRRPPTRRPDCDRGRVRTPPSPPRRDRLPRHIPRKDAS